MAMDRPVMWDNLSYIFTRKAPFGRVLPSDAQLGATTQFSIAAEGAIRVFWDCADWPCPAR